MAIKNPKASITPLRDLEGDKCFWIHNGPVVKNLYELQSSLESMDEATFKYHVNEEKNDFYNWIKDSIQDKNLAKRLITLKTKEQIANSINERIKELTVKPKINVKKEIKPTVKETTKKVQKKAIEKQKEREHSNIALPHIPQHHITHITSARPFSAVATLIALVTLFIIVGAINVSKGVITGATITDIQREASPLIGILIIAAIAVLVMIVIRKTKKP